MDVSIPQSFNDLGSVESFMGSNDPKSGVVQSNKDAIIKAINEFSNNYKESLNAKNRRKISRYIAGIEDPIRDDALDENSLSNDSTTNSAGKLIILLSKSKHLKDVETAMNSFILQDEYDNLKTNEIGKNLKSQLQRILNEPTLINRILKRRIERLLFVLSDTNEQEVMKAQKQITATQNRIKNNTKVQNNNNNNNNNKVNSNDNNKNTKTIDGNTNNQSTDKSYHKHEELSTFQKSILTRRLQEIIPKLHEIDSANTLEIELTQLSDLKIECADIEDRNSLQLSLSKLLIDSLSYEINAKLRRRIKRLIERCDDKQINNVNSASDRDIQESSHKAQNDTNTHTSISVHVDNNSKNKNNNNNDNNTTNKVTKVDIISKKSTSTNATINNNTIVNPKQYIVQYISQLRHLQSASDLESILNALQNLSPTVWRALLPSSSSDTTSTTTTTTNSTIDHSNNSVIRQLIEILNDILYNQRQYSSNSKLKRKLSRFIERVEKGDIVTDTTNKEAE